MKETGTLMDALKEAIREQHARIERLPFIAALVRRELPLRCYVAQLRGLAVLHAVLDHELRQVELPGVTPLLQGRPSRLSQLRRDLSALDRQLLPDCLPAGVHLRRAAEQIRRHQAEEPERLLGVLYVLEGTTLGNTVHLPDVTACFGAAVAGCTHYYAGYGSMTDEYWQEFRSVMNACPLAGEQRSRVITAARQFLDQLEALLGALHPVPEEGWGFTAGMLNPEAGQHLVPAHPEELQAALVAARRCREEFPYFEERYRERGRAFAKSDTAWLVTLADLPHGQLLGQVEWLGRVLANRGMPRITLERQLELLHDELLAAVPARRKQYEALLEAAASLRRERIQAVPELLGSAIADDFNRTAQEILPGRLYRTGELIVSAVCDQAAGISAALDSLLDWLADPQLFPEPWVTEVRRTVQRALGASKRLE